MQLPKVLQVDGVPVPSGPNSLLESLLRVSRTVIEGELPSCALKLREQLIDELLQRPYQYGLDLNRSRRRELKLMRLNHQIPSMDVCLAASALYLVRINVSIRRVILLRTIRMCFSSAFVGVHFNPLVETRQFNVHVVPSCVIRVSAPVYLTEDESSGEVELSCPPEECHQLEKKSPENLCLRCVWSWTWELSLV